MAMQTTTAAAHSSGRVINYCKMVCMKHRLCTRITGMLYALPALLLSACIPVQMHQSVPAETNAIKLPTEQFTGIIVAPYFHRAEVNSFSAALAKADAGIEVIDASTVFQSAFPERDPNIELALNELLQDANRGRIRANGVRFIVVLSPFKSSAVDSDGVFIGVYAHGSSTISASLMTGLVDLDDPAAAAYLETRAEGEDSATWILPYLGLFIFGSTPDVAEGVMDGIAHNIAGKIRSLDSSVPVKITVLAGNWDSAKLAYEKRQALQQLREKAEAGEADAQWDFYSKQPLEENLVWLCRAADQGHKAARNELGRLYFYGSSEYRKFNNTHIPKDLSHACLWFQLAGQAQITESPRPEVTVPAPTPVTTAEVERTAKAMTAQQIETAEILLLNWTPGQCAGNLSQHAGATPDIDSKLFELCTAADAGSLTAREALGRAYFFGSMGVEEDLPRAYMWYQLAARVYATPGMQSGSMQSICDAMTPEQRRVAGQLLERWKAGQCEMALVLPVTR
jgi:TPR repeat protein